MSKNSKPVLIAVGFVFAVFLGLILLGYNKEKTAAFPDQLQNGFKRVKDLRIGDRVYVLENNKLVLDKITGIDKKYGTQKAHNLYLESGPNTYFADNFAVHNKSPTWREFSGHVYCQDDAGDPGYYLPNVTIHLRTHSGGVEGSNSDDMFPVTDGIGYFEVLTDRDLANFGFHIESLGTGQTISATGQPYINMVGPFPAWSMWDSWGPSPDYNDFYIDWAHNPATGFDFRFTSCDVSPAECNEGCGTDAACESPLICDLVSSTCRNNLCPSSITCEACPTCNIVDGLAITVAHTFSSCTVGNINWDDKSWATGILLKGGSLSSSGYTFPFPKTPPLAYTNTGLTPDTDYVYNVSCYKSGVGEGVSYGPIYCHTDSVAPPLPLPPSSCDVVVGLDTRCRSTKVNSQGLIYDGGVVDCPQ